MHIQVNGVAIPAVTDARGNIDIQIDVSPSGEECPPIIISATGGTLDVYRSRITASGTVDFHLFGDEEADSP